MSGQKTRMISFSAPMARAVRDGRKTQTRRVINPQPVCDGAAWAWYGRATVPMGRVDSPSFPVEDAERFNPFGAPGDRLLVREPWRTSAAYDHLRPLDLPIGAPVWYLADDRPPVEGRGPWGRRRPGRFMPRALCRSTIEVESVRVERLQAISSEDAASEGCTWDQAEALIPVTVRARRGCGLDDERMTNRSVFASLWDSINEGRGFGWDANPWVWVVTFRAFSVGWGAAA